MSPQDHVKAQIARQRSKTPVTRVALYIRISTDEANQPYSLGAQETKLRELVESRDGSEVVRVYSDQASGAKSERPGLQQMLRDAAAGRFDVLLVYRLDRLARSMSITVQILGQLEEAGVTFQSATEAFETATPSGRMMIHMLAAFAELERAQITDRVRNGQERKAALGNGSAAGRPMATRSTATASLPSTPPRESSST